MNEKEKNVKLPFFGVPKLYPFIKPYLPMIIFMIALGILSSLIDSVYPIFNRYALDNFVGKKTLVLGIVALLCGALDLANEYWIKNSYMNLFSSGLFVGVAVWYCVSVKKSYGK